MTTYYVRPAAAHGNTPDGLSYDTAWLGWANVVWGASGVGAGETLYVCGTHASSGTLAVGSHGAASEAQRVMIRGDYSADPGSIVFTGNVFFNVSKAFTTIYGLSIVGDQNVCIYDYPAASGGLTIDSCDLSGGVNGILIGNDVSRINTIISNNTIHDLGGSTGSTGRAIQMSASTASKTASGITISNNTIYNCPGEAIRLSVEAAAFATTTINNVIIKNNTIYDCGSQAIWVRSGDTDTSTELSLYSTGVIVSGNNIDRCGTVAGDGGAGGGIAVSGYTNALIKNNRVWNVYTLGAAIQTAKNDGITICYNDIRSPRSGTPTAQYSGGFPIDGNGIFFDNKTQRGVAYGNFIKDCVATGVTNSGTGIAFWDAKNATYYGNVIVDCYRGLSYGDDYETGNCAYNNTFVNCDIGVLKIGTQVLSGDVTVKNNIFVDCETGFSIGSNPGIVENYNCVYGSTTAYSGITKGANSIETNPLLLPNYAPSQNSPCIGAGLFIASNLTDMNGRRFRVSPTIGAYEANPRVCLSTKYTDI